MWQAVKEWAQRCKRDVIALYIAARDPRTPWHAKGIALAVAVYALSPIDLIPDFIPVLGYVDDLLLLPLGILLAIRLIPPHLMIEFRQAAGSASRPASHWSVTGIVAAIWIGAAVAFSSWTYQWLILAGDARS